jgi:hypothetical protein
VIRYIKNVFIVSLMKNNFMMQKKRKIFIQSDIIYLRVEEDVNLFVLHDEERKISLYKIQFKYEILYINY